MRREKTLKVCANFHVKPGTKIEEHAGSEKARVMVVVDCSDGDVRPTMVNMCCKFGSAEKAELFQSEFEKAMEHMKQFEGEESEAKKEGDEAADALADDLAAKADTKEEEEKKEEA
jgi:Ran-binding protein 1